MKKIIGFISFFISFIYICNGQNSEDIKFFESKIRPALSQYCYDCHSSSSSKIKGGLKLDTKEDSLKGGNSGPAIVPKDLNKSLLIKSIRYTDEDLSMPPKSKLPDSVIKDFETWIKNGAFDPRTGITLVSVSEEEAKKHWAYSPVVKPAVPKIRSSWVQNEVDSFILETSSAKKIFPSEIADKKTLIRRLYYTLTGLPPSLEDVNEFVNDKSENAYEKIVDKLLSSYNFGEKWARHWLDTARYSDTTGSVNGNRENRYTYSWTYRNYVIDSFYQDKPFNNFIIEQIAADKVQNLPKENLAALGFLTLGKNSGNGNDVIDDQIDAVSKGFMATTIVCARCHDHKFDPISTKDYYALHGIFNSSYVPEDNEKPLLITIVETPEYKKYFEEKIKLETNVVNFKQKKFSEAFLDFQTNTYRWLYGAYALNGIVNSNKQNFIRTNTLNPRMMQRWGDAMRFTVPQRRNERTGKNNTAKVNHPSFLLYAKMFNVTNNFQAEFRKLLTEHAEDINPYLLRRIKSTPISSMIDLAKIYGAAVIDSRRIYLSLESNLKNAPEGLVDFYESIYKNNGPLDMNIDNFQRYYSDNGKTMRYDGDVRREVAKLVTHELTNPATPPRAMAMLDKSRPSNSQILIKGDPSKRGPSVERKFPEFFGYLNSNTFTNGSGRLELAMGIADNKNPLTPRVAINRIWMHIMGDSFVSTPDDFGMSTPKPIHINLMNYLAAEFIEHNWSQKYIIKKLVMSSTYKQSSLIDARKFAKDPSNEFYHRANMQRLDFEELRDTILTISGKLDNQKFNQPIDLFSDNNNRRTIYGMIDRSRFPELLTTFDFATPEMTTGKRFETTVPKQALYLMNSNDMIKYSESVYANYEFAKLKITEDKIKFLFNLFYQRDPSKTDISIAKRFFNIDDITLDNTNMSPNDDKKYNKWEQYIQILFMSNELIYIN